MFELSDLHVFRTVVEAGGVVRASEVLHRAQSSITARIFALEEKLGVPLFLREGRRMQLSAAGHILLGYSGRLLELAREAGEAVRDNRPSGVFRLGAMESTAAVRLPRPLGIFHETYPDVAMELYSGDPLDLVNQVLRSELDAALVVDPVRDQRLDSAVIYTEELVVIAEERHPPIRSPRDIPSRSILAFHHGCPHRRRLEEWFARSHVVPTRVLEVGSYHLILGCVAIGMGVALVPKRVLDTFAERGRLSVHPLRSHLGRVYTRLVWRKDAPQAKVQALARILMDAQAGEGEPSRHE